MFHHNKLMHGWIFLGLILGVVVTEALRAGPQKQPEDSSAQQHRHQQQQAEVLRRRNLQENLFQGKCGLNFGATEEACASLIATTTEVCDCYTFCGGELISCYDFGEPSAFKCSTGDAIAGCSRPEAEEEEGEGPDEDFGMIPDEDGMVADATNSTNTTILE